MAEERNEGGRYLHFAAHLGDVDATKMLFEKGADVNAVEKDKWAPLHIAAEQGHVDVASILLQKGADVNAVQKKNCTALHLAAREGHADVMLSHSESDDFESCSLSLFISFSLFLI